jgi:hypothetical protein
VTTDDAQSLVFGLCHEAGGLLTALRFHALAPARGAGDDVLGALTVQLSTRIGALLGMVRPLLEGPRDAAAGADIAGVLRQVERELEEAGVGEVACEVDASLPAARCDPELLRQLLVARILAALEPGQGPLRVRLTSAACARGLAIGVEAVGSIRSGGASPAGVALVERIAGSLLAAVGGAVVPASGPAGSDARFELESASRRGPRA